MRDGGSRPASPNLVGVRIGDYIVTKHYDPVFLIVEDDDQEAIKVIHVGIAKTESAERRLTRTGAVP